MRKALVFAALGIVGLAAWPATAAPRSARCVIASAESATWRGPCMFLAERGGSFSISPPRGDFGDGIDIISVSLIRPGVAEVRGLTSDGINSRWGEARRSTRDRACWIGEDFSICVY
ncbi:MAG TPA: hypothetical protein VLK25_10655 [Allosphingosinicella sp.]|nr:hypothetical protein [Allosphingosinicella sp.]